jgi:hypothetical protein
MIINEKIFVAKLETIWLAENGGGREVEACRIKNRGFAS